MYCLLFVRWERREFQERRARSPARWRHDKFEEVEAEAEEMDAEQAQQTQYLPQDEKLVRCWAVHHSIVLIVIISQGSGIDDVWAHDKYEELMNIDGNIDSNINDDGNIAGSIDDDGNIAGNIDDDGNIAGKMDSNTDIKTEP